MWHKRTTLAISAFALTFGAGWFAGATVSKIGFASEQTMRQTKTRPTEGIGGEERISSNLQDGAHKPADGARSAATTGAAKQDSFSKNIQKGGGLEVSHYSGSDEPHLATVLADPALFGAILENTPGDSNKLLAWPKR